MAQPQTDRRHELETFMERVRPRLQRYLRSRRIPEADAEDLIQQTLLALFNQWDEIRDPDRWVLGALKKNCLMFWRGQRRRLYDAVEDTTLEWLASPETPSQERQDLRQDLGQAMARLPERYRSVLRLRFGLGYEPSEVARRLGYRASSMGKVTYRCLAALDEELERVGWRRAGARQTGSRRRR